MLNVTVPPPPFYRLYRDDALRPAPPRLSKVDKETLRRSSAFLQDYTDDSEDSVSRKKGGNTAQDDLKIKGKLETVLNEMTQSENDEQYLEAVKKLDDTLLELPSIVKRCRRRDIEAELSKLLECYQQDVAEFAEGDKVTQSNSQEIGTSDQDTYMGNNTSSSESHSKDAEDDEEYSTQVRQMLYSIKEESTTS